MSTWLDAFTRTAARLEANLDIKRFEFKLRHDLVKPITIMPYRGHGTAERLYLKGRVLECPNVSLPSEETGVWENLLNMYRRFDSREIPNARVAVTFGEQQFEVSTDTEGYFDIQIVPEQPIDVARVWHQAKLRLVDPIIDGDDDVTATGYMLVPPPHSAFGIISDIDDTVVRTGATDPLTMARIVMLNNPRTRLPFEGVAAFYAALRAGAQGDGYNPVFYVSSSPWNLYDLLVDFFNFNGIPLGPIFLRDVGLEPEHLLKSGHLEHKIAQIQTIMDSHPELPFILIGDSGQEDPEIYREVVQQYPGRVKAIYIRDVTLDDRDGAVSKVIEDLRNRDVEMLLVPDTVTAAEHAAAHGWMTAAAIQDVREDKRSDEADPTLTEQVTSVLPAEEPKDEPK